MYVVRRRTGFLVPNELLQQQAGQRQDRTAEETMGHITHQHVSSPEPLFLGNVRWMTRDTRAEYGRTRTPLRLRRSRIEAFVSLCERESCGNFWQA